MVERVQLHNSKSLAGVIRYEQDYSKDSICEIVAKAGLSGPSNAEYTVCDDIGRSPTISDRHCTRS